MSRLNTVIVYVVAVLAPMSTAWAVYDALVRWVGFPAWVALCGAVALELVGMAAVMVTLTLRRYNVARRGDEPGAPMGMAYAIVGGYVVVAELLTVLLDPVLTRWTAARGVFPLLSLVGFALAGLMDDQAARVASVAESRAQEAQEAAQAKAERAQGRARRAQEKAQVLAVQAQPIAQGLDTRGKVLAFYRQDPYGSLTAAGRAAGVSRQRVGQIVEELEVEGIINRNGKVTVME